MSVDKKKTATESVWDTIFGEAEKLPAQKQKSKYGRGRLGVKDISAVYGEEVQDDLYAVSFYTLGEDRTAGLGILDTATELVAISDEKCGWFACNKIGANELGRDGNARRFGGKESSKVTSVDYGQYSFAGDVKMTNICLSIKDCAYGQAFIYHNYD